MSDHTAAQDQAAGVRARVVNRTSMKAFAESVAPQDAKDRAGVWARLDPDGTVTVNVFTHHDDMDRNGNVFTTSSSVLAEPTKAVEEALRGILARHTSRLLVIAAHDQHQNRSGNDLRDLAEVDWDDEEE